MTCQVTWLSNYISEADTYSHNTHNYSSRNAMLLGDVVTGRKQIAYHADNNLRASPGYDSVSINPPYLFLPPTQIYWRSRLRPKPKVVKSTTLRTSCIEKTPYFQGLSSCTKEWDSCYIISDLSLFSHRCLATSYVNWGGWLYSKKPKAKTINATVALVLNSITWI